MLTHSTNRRTSPDEFIEEPLLRKTWDQSRWLVPVLPPLSSLDHIMFPRIHLVLRPAERHRRSASAFPLFPWHLGHLLNEILSPRCTSGHPLYKPFSPNPPHRTLLDQPCQRSQRCPDWFSWPFNDHWSHIRRRSSSQGRSVYQLNHEDITFQGNGSIDHTFWIDLFIISPERHTVRHTIPNYFMADIERVSVLM